MNMSDVDISQILSLLQKQMEGTSSQAQLIISSITALAIIFLTLLKIYKTHSRTCEEKKQEVIQLDKNQKQATMRSEVVDSEMSPKRV